MAQNLEYQVRQNTIALQRIIDDAKRISQLDEFTNDLSGNEVIAIDVAGNTKKIKSSKLIGQESVVYENTKTHPLSLTGIDQTLPELTKIAEAVKLYGPFTCAAGQQMVFKTTTTVGTQSNGDIVTRYYRLIKNMTSIGGVGVDELILPSWFMPDGTGEYSNPEAEGIIAELGDIGTADVWTAFNLGNAGEAWDMAEFRFVRATQNTEVKFWAFQGMERYYGGPDMGVEPDIFEAFESDFFLITGQPPAQNEVIFDYDDIDELILRQSEQVIDSVILVRDAIDDTNITFAASENKRQALYKLKSSTKTGSITDYIVTAVPYGNNASIVSLTGIGVDLTDPTNPKIINAQSKKTAAFDIAIDDNGRTIFNNSNTGAFNPSTIAYPNKFEAILKNIGGTDATFVGNAATDWTYIYNNGTPVASISVSYKRALLIQRVESEKILRISENIALSQAELDAKANKRYNVITAATAITLLAEWKDADLLTTATTDITLTVPLGLVGDFQGFAIGAGKVKPVGETGVTINVSPLWKKETTGAGAPWALKQTAPNEYLLYGQLEMI